MRILVTGGAGFIGSAYARSLATGRYPAIADPEIVVLDLLTYAGTLTNLAPVLNPPRDIRNVGLVTELMADVDVVVHLAAESHVDRSIVGAADFVAADVVGTQVLLRAALDAGVGRFVHVSTGEVYGSIVTGSWPETHPLEPNSRYSGSKAGADLLARAYHRTHGLPVCITRCSYNYGPYQFPEKGHPAVRNEPARRAPRAALRRRAQRPRLAARRRPLPRHPARRREGAPGGELQHRRGHRADEPRTEAPGRCRADESMIVANHSVSSRAVIRGVHFADTPPGQAKYVYCPRGAALDVVADLRLGPPTFGVFEAVELDGRCTWPRGSGRLSSPRRTIR
jgi:NAD(P)-dependent dehydrogenase (short-subunit alcohol dehydrogenase family)